MVEIFRTNVIQKSQARLLVDLIQHKFSGYHASFDLEDCDHVLRISCKDELNAGSLISFLHDFGFHAEVLTDEIPGLDSQIQDMLYPELAARPY